MPLPPPPLRLLIGCLLLALAPTVQALPDTVGHASRGAHAPEASADGLLQLLHERGLVQAAMHGEVQALARQVRDSASELVISAMNFLGVPYRRGGASPEQGFDCSGFTRHIFERTLGLVLPHRADQQASDPGLARVGRDDLRPGDLVFFNTMRRAFSHVGIYIGEGKFIHAPRTGAQVRVEDMQAVYWARRFNGARRADREPDVTPAVSSAFHGPSSTPP